MEAKDFVETQRHEIAPAEGKLGVLLVGLGAVASTFIAGVEHARRGTAQPDRLAHPDGHDPPRQAHRQPHAADQGLRAAGQPRRPRLRRLGPVPRQRLRGGRQVRRARPPRAHRADRRLPQGDQADARRLRPDYVKRLDGTNVKHGADARWSWPRSSARTSATSRPTNNCDRLVMVWCASTEIFIEEGPAHLNLEAFEAALEANDHVDRAVDDLRLRRAAWRASPSPTARPT